MAAFQWVAREPDFFVVAKAAGVNFHREGDTPGLLEQVAAASGDSALYPVHRLDRMTSGLLLIARNQSAASELSRVFAERQVSKFYLALGDRKPRKKQGRVVGDMAKGRRGDWLLLRSRHNPAVTDFISAAVQPGERLFLLSPKTGKTHQLRVAMKSLGAPIIGDPRYYPAGQTEDRGYLHAYGLGFHYQGEGYSYVNRPQEGARFLTPACEAVIATWADPWSLLPRPIHPES